MSPAIARSPPSGGVPGIDPAARSGARALWRRLGVTIRLDVRIQARSQLYTIGLGVGLVMALIFRYLVDPAVLRHVLPPALMFHLASTTCFFLAALVLFEKAQGTLVAQRVTPLRLGEYVASKLITLGAFAAIEGLVMVGVTQGLRFHLGWYLLAAFGLGALYTLLGLLLVAKHTSITEFLVPNGIVLGMLVPLPLLPYLGVWESPWWLFFPTQPQLILFTAAFEPVAPWRLVYAVLGSVLVLGLLWGWALRVFDRHLDGGRR